MKYGGEQKKRVDARKTTTKEKKKLQQTRKKYNKDEIRSNNCAISLCCYNLLIRY